MKYRIAVSYSIEVTAKDQSEAINAIRYYSVFDASVKDLSMSVINETADDPKPMVATAPEAHTNLTVKDNAPIASITGGAVNPLSVNSKTVSPEHTVVVVR